jgi:hypothetical protein
VFCVIFALELLLRIIAYRKRFLVGATWQKWLPGMDLTWLDIYSPLKFVKTGGKHHI